MTKQPNSYVMLSEAEASRPEMQTPCADISQYPLTPALSRSRERELSSSPRRGEAGVRAEQAGMRAGQSGVRAGQTGVRLINRTSSPFGELVISGAIKALPIWFVFGQTLPASL
jgi:hypothetical protein